MEMERNRLARKIGKEGTTERKKGRQKAYVANE